MTLLPGPGSAAVDAGDPATCGTAPHDVDQRGVSRPQGQACDIGAVEVEGVPETPEIFDDGFE